MASYWDPDLVRRRMLERRSGMFGPAGMGEVQRFGGFTDPFAGTLEPRRQRPTGGGLVATPVVGGFAGGSAGAQIGVPGGPMAGGSGGLIDQAAGEPAPTGAVLPAGGYANIWEEAAARNKRSGWYSGDLEYLGAPVGSFGSEAMPEAYYINEYAPLYYGDTGGGDVYLQSGGVRRPASWAMVPSQRDLENAPGWIQEALAEGRIRLPGGPRNPEQHLPKYRKPSLIRQGNRRAKKKGGGGEGITPAWMGGGSSPMVNFNL